MKIKLLIISFIIFLISCSDSSKSFFTFEKLREKNFIKNLEIINDYGNTFVVGWENDFIEIKAEKILESNISTDLNLLTLTAENSEDEDKLYVGTKIPTRVSGEINLTVFVPVYLQKLFIKSQKVSNVSIEKYAGDINLNVRKGNIDLDFEGRELRVSSESGVININVLSVYAADIIILNEKGTVNCNVKSLRKESYIDISSESSNIDISFMEDVGYTLFTNTLKDSLSFDSGLEVNEFYGEDFYYFIGKKNKNDTIVKVYINNMEGNTVIKSLN